MSRFAPPPSRLAVEVQLDCRARDIALGAPALPRALLKPLRQGEVVQSMANTCRLVLTEHEATELVRFFESLAGRLSWNRGQEHAGVCRRAARSVEWGLRRARRAV